MTTKLEQAARQALGALVRAEAMYGQPNADIQTALREALAEQAEQEPVAWRVRGYNQFKTGDPAPWRYVDDVDKPSVNNPDCCDFEPLYAAPVCTKDLTDDEIAMLIQRYTIDGKIMPFALCEAAIAADREKNNANNNT